MNNTYQILYDSIMFRTSSYERPNQLKYNMATWFLFVSFSKRYLFCLVSTRNHQYRFSCEIRVNSISGQNSFLTFYEVCKVKNCQKSKKQNFPKTNVLFYLFLFIIITKNEASYFEIVKSGKNFSMNSCNICFKVKLHSRYQQTLLLHLQQWQLLRQTQLQFSTRIFF